MKGKVAYTPTVEDLCGVISCDECPHKDSCGEKWGDDEKWLKARSEQLTFSSD